MSFPEPTATLPDDIHGMNVAQPKHQLALRNRPFDGPKHVLVTRLQEARRMNSNQAYHAYTKLATEAAAGIDKAEKDVAELEAQLAAAKQRLANHRHEQSEAQRLLEELKRRLFFAPKLPGCVLLSILGQLGKKAGQRAACVQREWQSSVATAKRMGMYDIKVISVAAGLCYTVVCSSAGAVFTFGGHFDDDAAEEDEPEFSPHLGHGEIRFQLMPKLVEALAKKEVIGVSAATRHTAVWTNVGELFTFGSGNDGQLGHGGEEHEHVPRRVEALGGKKVIGASAGDRHSVVWTDAGELFTFGSSECGALGHGGEADELVPRRVHALEGKNVIGASARGYHTAVWTDVGELFTFGAGWQGLLGHGGGEHESVPRRVEALSGKKVIGVSARENHTAAWTDAGELFTFGRGHYGQLGHGGEENELVPRRVEALEGKKVIGASAGLFHTAAWTDAGELFTFGYGDDGPLGHGQLGHGGDENELVPRRVEALEGKKVIGASAGGYHTAAWTDAGELFTFGYGDDGRLGHAELRSEHVPRLLSEDDLASLEEN